MEKKLIVTVIIIIITIKKNNLNNTNNSERSKPVCKKGLKSILNASLQNEQDGCQNRSGEESKSAAENWAKWGGCQNSQVVCELGPP